MKRLILILALTVAAFGQTRGFVAPSGGDDTAGIQAVINAGIPVHLSGAYYISALTINHANDIHCDGGTILYKTTSTGDFITIHYGGGEANQESLGMKIDNCTVKPALGITPTSGFAFNVSGISSSAYLSGLHLESNHIYGMAGGFRLGNFMVNNWLRDNFVDTVTNGEKGCLYYAVENPGGDNHIDGQQCTGSTPYANINIERCDTTPITNLKLNGGGQVNFLGGGLCHQMSFINPSIELSTTCAFNFPTSGTLPDHIYIVGGEMTGGSTAKAFCNYTGISQVAYQFLDNYSADGAPGWVSNLYGSGAAGNSGSTGTAPTSTCIGAWVNVVGTVPQTIIGTLDMANGAKGWELSITNYSPGVPVLGIMLDNHFPDNATDVAQSGTLTSGSHYLGAQYDSTNHAAGVTLYVDGAVVSTVVPIDNLSGSIVSGLSAQIGSRADGTQPLLGSASFVQTIPNCTWDSIKWANNFQSGPGTY